MIRVILQLESQLRSFVPGGELLVDVAEGSTVSDALRTAAEQIPRLGAHLFHADGRPQRSLLLFCSGQPLAPEAAGTRTVQDREVITLLLPISGG